MKTKILILLLLCLPILLDAQNNDQLGAQQYEQFGDELFAQSQYEKAKMKYEVAVDMSSEHSALQVKIENCSKCASLLTSAKLAEESASSSADYERASKLYSDLYAIHALQTYKSKANDLQRRANAMREQQHREKLEQQQKAIKEAAEARSRAEKEERELHPEQWIQNRLSNIKQLSANGKLYKISQPNQYQLLYELYIDKDKDGKWLTGGRTLALRVHINKSFTTFITARVLKGGKSDLDEILDLYKSNGGTDLIRNRAPEEPGVYLVKKYGYATTEEQIANDIKSYMDILAKARREYVAKKTRIQEEQRIRKEKQQEAEKQADRKIQQDLYAALSHPMANVNLNWFPKKELKAAIKKQYPELTEKKSWIYGRPSGNKSYIRFGTYANKRMTLSSVSLELEANNGTQIDVKYRYDLPSDVDFIDARADIERALRTDLGFNKSSTCYNGTLDKGISIEGLQVVSGNGILELNFSISK